MKAKLLRKLRENIKITFDGDNYKLYVLTSIISGDNTYKIWNLKVTSDKINICISEYHLFLRKKINESKYKEKTVLS
jgi:hypothetical protein